MNTKDALFDANKKLKAQKQGYEDERTKFSDFAEANVQSIGVGDDWEAKQESNNKTMGVFKARLDAMKTSIEIGETNVTALQKSYEMETTPNFPANLPMPDGSNSGVGLGNTGNDNISISEKSIYVTKYGDIDSGLKAIVKEMYGSEGSYLQGRHEQNKAFALYLGGKIGEKSVTTLMGHNIVPDDTELKQMILQGETFENIRKNTTSIGFNVNAGVFVPPDYSREILSRTPSENVIRRFATIQPTATDTITFPRRDGGDDQFTGAARAFWTNELPNPSDNKTAVKYGQDTISVHTMSAILPLSKFILDDSPFNIAKLVTDELREATLIKEDNAFMIADGVGKPKGILPGGNSLGHPDISVVEYSLSGAPGKAGTWFDALTEMEFKIPGRYLTNAKYVAKRITFGEIAKAKGGDGHYLWTERYGSNATGVPATLRGFGWMEQEALPPVAINNYAVILANFQGYRIADRRSLSIKLYDTVAGSNEITYELFHRVGGKVVHPWSFVVLKIVA